MRHLVLGLIVAFLAYFGWAYMGRSDKIAAKRFTRRHIWALVIITMIAVFGVVVSYYNRSINLL